MANTESVLLLDGYKGLGTSFWIELFLDEHESRETLPAIRSFLEETIASFDATYSRFKETSLLSELNRNKVIAYDHHLAYMVAQAQEASRITHNVFSIFIKEALEEKGYGVQTGQKSFENKEQNSAVTIHEKTITLHGNKGIDLGGIGKGYLIDLLAKILKETYNLHYFTINGGGDIYVTSNHGSPIKLYLEHPGNPDEYIASIEVTNMAFCSSSSFKRMWHKDGKEVNHFIAHRDVWAASYVLGTTATLADMYATVYCIESTDQESLERIAKETGTEYLVITEEGKMLHTDGFKNQIHKN